MKERLCASCIFGWLTVAIMREEEREKKNEDFVDLSQM